jgi:FtsP/CotA-like multicopper oxidase with cupredoxin domain
MRRNEVIARLETAWARIALLEAENARLRTERDLGYPPSTVIGSILSPGPAGRLAPGTRVRVKSAAVRDIVGKDEYGPVGASEWLTGAWGTVWAVEGEEWRHGVDSVEFDGYPGQRYDVPFGAIEDIRDA